MAVRLVIADDHPLLIDGLKSLLDEMEGVEVIGSAGNGWDLLNILRNEPVDMVLLDLQMPRMDGIESLKILRRDFPGLRIIVFTNYGQPKLIKEMKALGAHGYLLKDTSSTVLKQAVTAVAGGGTWFTDIQQEQQPPVLLTNGFMKKYQLTNREAEIICQIAEGLTTREIASKLFVSEFTINTHRRNICRKLNIYTPVGLINFAKTHGMVP